jgi:hypothetical protein
MDQTSNLKKIFKSILLERISNEGDPFKSILTVFNEDIRVSNEDETVPNEDETVLNSDEKVLNENETVLVLNEDDPSKSILLE